MDKPLRPSTFQRGVDECPVCLDGLALCRLACRHVFCYDCIDRLLSDGRAHQNARCPLCRAVFWWSPRGIVKGNPRWEIPNDARPSLRLCRRLLRLGVDMRGVFQADPPLLDAVLASCHARPWVLAVMTSLASNWPNLAADVRLSSVASRIAALAHDQQGPHGFVVFRRLLSYRRNPRGWDLVQPLAESLGILARCREAIDACGQGTRRLAMLDPAKTIVTLDDGRTLNLLQYWMLLNVPGVADGCLPFDPKEAADLVATSIGDLPVWEGDEPILRAFVSTARGCAARESRIDRIFDRPGSKTISMVRDIRRVLRSPCTRASWSRSDYVDRVVFNVLKCARGLTITADDVMKTLRANGYVAPPPCAGCEPMGATERCSACLLLTIEDIAHALGRLCSRGYAETLFDPALGTTYTWLD